MAPTDGLRNAFDALLAGRADYVINGTYPALNVAIEQGIRDRITVLDPPLVKEGVFIAFSKKSPCSGLATKFGKRIDQMIKSGEIASLVEKTIQDWEAKLRAGR